VAIRSWGFQNLISLSFLGEPF